MAIKEHVALIKRGVWQWNKWRCKNHSIIPDLSGADLRGIELYDEEFVNFDEYDPDLNNPRFAEVSPGVVDLSDAYLHGTNLVGACLCEASFRRANLSEANLAHADLWKANLSETDLSGANLQNANLEEADLSGADLRGADLRPIGRDSEDNAEDNDSDAYWEGTDVTRANLHGADFRGTNLRGLDLSKSRGLSRAQIAVAVIDGDTKLPSE